MLVHFLAKVPGRAHFSALRPSKFKGLSRNLFYRPGWTTAILCITLSTILTGCHYHNSNGYTAANRSIDLVHRNVPAEDFLRISEYFTGEESTGNRIYLRSDPTQRGGYYWIFSLKDLPDKKSLWTLTIDAQIPGTPDVQTQTFQIEELRKGAKYLWVGWTGADWPGSNLKPIAWRISIVEQEGTEILSEDSFLWNQKPHDSQKKGP